MKVSFEISDEKAEKIVKGIFENFPEALDGSSLRCVHWKYDKFQFKFHDTEEDKLYVVTLPMAMKAFKRFLEINARGELPGIPWEWNGEDFDYDAYACDAIAQLCCFDKIIYG